MEVLREEDIEAILAREEGPCISIYMAVPPATENRIKQMSIKFKNLIKEGRQQLQQDWEYDSREIGKLLEPAERLSGDRSFWQEQDAGLAVFSAPEMFILHKAPVEFQDRAVVSSHFNVKQLIPEIRYNQRFYLLALSQNQNRVYECTRSGFKEIEVPEIPESLEQTLKWDDPERSIQYHTHQGGGSTTIYHGQGVTDRDNEEDLLRYLRQVNRGLHEFLQKRGDPLILACVEELFPLYRKVNTYPGLLENFIKGSPESSPEGEVHRQAWELMEPELARKRKGIIGDYLRLKQTDRASIEIREIIPAAFYSRVDTLLLEEGSERRGRFNPEEGAVHFGGNRKESYDLLNFAAVQTLLNGGEVYLLGGEEMPDDSRLAAVYRY